MLTTNGLHILAVVGKASLVFYGFFSPESPEKSALLYFIIDVISYFSKGFLDWEGGNAWFSEVVSKMDANWERSHRMGRENAERLETVVENQRKTLKAIGDLIQHNELILTKFAALLERLEFLQTNQTLLSEGQSFLLTLMKENHQELKNKIEKIEKSLPQLLNRETVADLSKKAVLQSLKKKN